MDLKFRKLFASEVEVRVGLVNDGGVQLLLYKDSRCDQNILDETVTPTHWQRHHSRDNANCIVSIWDPDLGQWVSKEETGSASNTEAEKGLASDSFKRACVCWGIGRELYTAPPMFVKKDKLPHYVPKDGPNKAKCNDSFSVKEITYDGNAIASVTIEISYYDKVEGTVTFKNKPRTGSSTSSSAQSGGSKTASTKDAATVDTATSEITETDLSVMYAKGGIAGTSKEGIDEWIMKKYGVEASQLTRVQYDETCNALDRQAEKKKKAE